MAARRPKPLDWLQPAVLTGSLVPFAVIAWRAYRGSLGANPIATAMNQLGLLALLFLVACLTCTPLKIVSGWKWPIRVRKTLGLLAFFTALCHFLVYLVLDQVLMIREVIADIVKRPFITFGLAALLTMLPLALTSTKDALQRMGPKRWKRLHRLVYLAGAFAVIHYILRVKQDLTDPLLYGSIIGVLLVARLVRFMLDRRAAAART